MRTLTFALVAAAFGVACGDSTGPGKRAASVTGFAGDSQIAPTGAPFEFPVTFVTLGSDGQPIAGVHVTWTVSPAGAAIVNPATSISDDNGQVATAVTAGTVPQQFTVSATVPGVSAHVLFSGLVLDPCQYAKGIVLDQTFNGALATTDCNLAGQGWLYDFYAFSLPSGQQSIRVLMSSSAFDTYVDLSRGDGRYVGFDDDAVIGTVQNSQFDVILPGDVYVVGANSYNQGATGAYTVTVSNRSATLNACREVWVMGSVTISDAVNASDCTDPDTTVKSHFDVARVWLRDSMTINIAERSGALNPSLALFRIVPGPIVNGHYTRSLVTSNDDSTSGNPTAFISYTVPPGLNLTGPYDIIVGASGASETGAYTLEISTTPASSSRVPTSVPISGLRDWWWSAGTSLKRPKL